MVLQAYSLDGVSDSLRKAYKLFTDGKFSNALQAFNQMLWTIPLVVVTSRKEVDEVKELLTICRSAGHTNKLISKSAIALCSPFALKCAGCLKFCIGNTALNGSKDESSCGFTQTGSHLLCAVQLIASSIHVYICVSPVAVNRWFWQSLQPCF